MGLRLADLVGSEYLTRDLEQAGPVVQAGLDQLDRSPQLSLAIAGSHARSRAAFLSPGLLPARAQLAAPARRTVLAQAIALQPSVFGDGMLLSVLAGKVIVTQVAEPTNEVLQSVFSSILAGAEMLDITAADPQTEEYFFLKDAGQHGNDLEELERLAGSYNVTRSGLRSGGDQVCVVSRAPPASICLLYGVRRDRAVRQKLRAAHRLAVHARWIQEASLVRLGFHGEWTASERDQLVRAGEVRGWTGQEIHSTHKFPALAGQASNIRFQRDSQARQSRLRL